MHLIVLQIGLRLSNCIFFVLLKIERAYFSFQWWIKEFHLLPGKGMIVSGTIFLWKGTVGPQCLI